MITVLAILMATASAVPMQLNHQGRLMDSVTGVPLQGGNDVTLTLYDSAVGGAQLWSETSQPTFTEGYYNTILGSDTLFNPLDDAMFTAGPVYLGIAVGGGPELPTRQEVVSVPYAFLANTATNVSGGVVNATEVQINGTPVIDTSGNFIGTADGDTLAALSCFGGQVALFNGVAWACANAAVDTTLSEAEVEFFIENGPITLATGTSLNGATISTGVHTLDTHITESEVESFITNGPVNLFVGSLVDGVAISTGAHVIDTNTQLSDAEVDAFVINGALDFNASSTIGGQVISTGAHSVDTNTQLSDAEVDAFVVNGALNLNALTTIGGAAISTGAHVVDTKLSDAEVDIFVTNGPLDLASGSTLGGAVISTGAHVADTTLTDAEVDAFVVNGALDLNAASTIGGAAISTGAHTVAYTDALAIAAVGPHTVDTLASAGCANGDRVRMVAGAWTCEPAPIVFSGTAVSGTPVDMSAAGFTSAPTVVTNSPNYQSHAESVTSTGFTPRTATGVEPALWSITQGQIYQYDLAGTVIQQFAEPGGTAIHSGVTYDTSDNSIWVMRQTPGGQMTNMTTSGVAGVAVALPADMNDMITYDPSDDTFWLTGYSTQVVHVSRGGVQLQRFTVAGATNLRGVDVDPFDQSI